MQEYLSAVQSEGGEGLMLRKAGSKYSGSRSNTLLKVKVTSPPFLLSFLLCIHLLPPSPATFLF
jgi:ATP-dependent DNA ligase